MLKEQIEKIKSMIVKDNNASSKKKIENLVVFIIILIITLIIINYIWNDNNKDEKNIKSNETSTYKQLAQTSEIGSITTKTDLEQKLEDILSKIEGVGKVNVLITYSQSSEIIAMYNETLKSSSTQEEDSEGRNEKS